MKRFVRILSWRAPLAHHLSGTLDRLEDADVGPAPALQSGECLLNLGLGRFLLVAQESGGCHQPAIDAVAALRHLLLDIGCLQGMRLLRRAEAGDCHDLGFTDSRQRRHAGACRLAVEVHGTGAALRQSAAEMRIVETDIVAQCIEQRHVRIGIYRVDLTVDVQFEGLVHSGQLPWSRHGGLRPTVPSRYSANASLADAYGPDAIPVTGIWKWPQKGKRSEQNRFFITGVASISQLRGMPDVDGHIANG